MAILKAFKGLRPPQNIVKELASRPYDVLKSAEARIEAEGNPYSLLHIIKPEIDLAENINLYSEEVYNKAKENLAAFKANTWLEADGGATRIDQVLVPKSPAAGVPPNAPSPATVSHSGPDSAVKLKEVYEMVSPA